MKISTIRRPTEIATPKLVALGLASSAFFSATFLLNYAMYLGGGNWVWSASLRYFFLLPLLALWLVARSDFSILRRVFQIFVRHIGVWLLAGSVGCGVFYAGICFAADHARGWIIAATWQLTVLASPIVLLLYGFKFPQRSLFYSGIVVLGIVLINFQNFRAGLPFKEVIFGVVPVALSAFSYPIGNQILNAAKNGTTKFVSHMDAPELRSPDVGIFLMGLGSVPFWIFLIVATAPPMPTNKQLLGTLAVTLFAGIVATSIYFYARNATGNPFKIASVDATQSGEVLFTLLGEVLFFGAPLPDIYSLLGGMLVLSGLVAYCFSSAALEIA
jgi:drug/metabolite transporter (DMT)-like permease